MIVQDFGHCFYSESIFFLPLESSDQRMRTKIKLKEMILNKTAQDSKVDFGFQN